MLGVLWNRGITCVKTKSGREKTLWKCDICKRVLQEVSSGKHKESKRCVEV